MNASTRDVAFDKSLFELAQELVHVGTWEADLSTGEVQWSDELFRLMGLEPQSIRPTYDTYIGFVHPMDRARVQGIVAQAQVDKKPFGFDHHIIRADGTVVIHSSRGNIVCDANGVAIRMIGTCIDATERAEAQEALRESEVRFRMVFEQSAVGLAIADPGSRFVRVNESFARMLGYSMADLQGRSLYEVTHPDDLELTREARRHADNGRGSHTYEKRYLRRDGTIAWGRVTVSRLRYDDGQPDAFMAVVEDISEHKASGKALSRQSEILRGILEHLPVMVAIVGAEGRVEYSNREFTKVFGRDYAHVSVAKLLDSSFVDPQERERARLTLMTGGATWVDMEPRGPNGKTVPSSWASVTLSDGTSLVIGQDLTERRAMQQRLAQSQKMEALGQLAGGVAHDFNNLLTVITACATFVLDGVGENASAGADAREILAASDRAAALTKQLLAFSRRQMLQPEIVNVNDAVQMLGKSMRRLIGEHIQIDVVLDATRPLIEVDRHQLEQVVLNLAVNARDSIAEQGTITVTTSNVPANTSGQEYVCIAVSDDGEGITPDVQQHMFEPFYTTKPMGKGTGLGLATVLGIVEQSGGHIQVESERGKGATFRVMLPSSKACGVTRPFAAQPDIRGTGTVLLVEDEAGIRAVSRRILTECGFTVLEARHGGDAEELSAGYEGPIDLLVTDVIMPVMGGRELAQRIRKHRKNIPVLYVSGYTDDELLRKGILEPGAELLRKPFAPADLARAVQRLLMRCAA